MARTAEDVLREQLGQFIIDLCVKQAEIEALNEKLKEQMKDGEHSSK